MVQEQDNWKERNISESSSAAQQRLASASNETLENFEDDHERKKALWREIFYILQEKDEEFRLNFNKTWKDQKDRLIQNTIPILFNLLGQQFNTDRTELANILQQCLKSSRSTWSIHQNPSQGKVFDEKCRDEPQYSSTFMERMIAELPNMLIHLLHNILDLVTVLNYKRPRQRSHMIRVAQPDGVPDWTAGRENEKSDYSEEEDEEDEENDDDDDNENKDEDSNKKRGSGGGNGNDKRSGKRLAIDIIEERPNKQIA
ncbi:hypothetical protein F8M41_018374 [Gigaspora margarita]|uniref:Uncharacterized protein n=1 Tax=Gigaspora margarita TaxID=4874 RepID=A0A8H4EL98_GIGMA|nr:hypothetical protein F8M41_018374 [Gigaspora margarita]